MPAGFGRKLFQMGLPWSPAVLTGKLLWLRGDLGLSPSAWVDQSGSGNSATQSVGGNQPGSSTAIGGQACASFDGASQYYALPNIAGLTASSTILVVYKLKSTPGASALWSLYNITPDGTNYTEFFVAGSGNYTPITYSANMASGTAVGVAATTLDTSAHSSLWTYDDGTNTTPSSYTTSLDGISQPVVQSYLEGHSPGFRSTIGARDAAGSPAAVDIAEIIITNDVMSTQDQASLANYLLNRYGIGGLLPAAILHVVATGQSLSIGAHGTPVLTTTAEGQTLKLYDSTGVYDPTQPDATTLALVPCVAPLKTGGNESPEIAMIGELSSLMNVAGHPKFVVSASSVGVSGAPMVDINQGTASYANALYEARAIKNLNPGGAFSVGFTVLTHGEADAGSTIYLSQLVALQAAFQTDLQAITGQSSIIPMILSQQTTSPGGPPGVGSNTTALAAWQAAVQNPTLFLCSGPKYQYPYFTDDLHMINTGYVQLGEKYGQVAATYTTQGAWQPLQPVSVVRVGTTVTVTTNAGTAVGPVLPLVFDGSATPPHQSGGLAAAWSNAKGFEAYDRVAVGGYSSVYPHTMVGCTVGTPISLQVTGHGFTTGDTVYCNSFSAPVEVNGQAFVVTVVDANNFTLNGSSAADAWVGNGFIFSPITITSATISGNEVVLTLTRTPVWPITISYADVPDNQTTTTGVFGAGRFGLIRDSEPFIGRSGANNYNWMVEFYEVIT